MPDPTSRPRPALVLLHGAFHTSRCWEPTVRELERQAPDLAVIAVDLPGRAGVPGDLGTLTIAQCVDSVVDQIEHAGLDEVVVVAHSLGGLIAPGVVTRLGAGRVVRLALLAAVIPPEGRSDLDLIAPPVRWLISRLLRPGAPRRPPSRLVARSSFCNGMSPEQRELVLSQLVPEAPGLFHEPVTRADLPAAVPRSWILPLRDRANPPRKQRSCIDHLGGVDEVVEIGTCHDAMVSEPAELAGILARWCAPAGAVPRS